MFLIKDVVVIGKKFFVIIKFFFIYSLLNIYFLLFYIFSLLNNSIFYIFDKFSFAFSNNFSKSEFDSSVSEYFISFISDEFKLIKKE